MGAAAALIVMKRQQELVDRFISAGAITADKAKPLNDIGVQPGLMFRKLERF